MTNIRARQPYARRPAPQNDLKPFLDTEFANIQRAIPVPLVRAVFADDTVQASDDTIEVDATAGPITVTLPPADRLQFLRVSIIRADSSANAVAVVGDTSPAGTIVLLAPGDAITVQSDGASWLVFPSQPFFPILPGETGVVNASYPVRCLQRYGASPSATAAANRAAIQNALDSAHALGGGTLTALLCGFYDVDDTLTWPSGVNADFGWAAAIDGATEFYGVWLQWFGAINKPMVSLFDKEYVRIRGLGLDGGLIARSCVLIDSDNAPAAHNVVFENCNFWNAERWLEWGTSGATGCQSDQVNFLYCKFYNPTVEGVVINSQNATQESIFDNCQFICPTANAINMFRVVFAPYQMEFNRCTFGAPTGWTGASLRLETGTTSGGQNLILKNNGFELGGTGFAFVVPVGVDERNGGLITLEDNSFSGAKFQFDADRYISSKRNQYLTSNPTFTSGSRIFSEQDVFTSGAWTLSGGAQVVTLDRLTLAMVLKSLTVSDLTSAGTITAPLASTTTGPFALDVSGGNVGPGTSLANNATLDVQNFSGEVTVNETTASGVIGKFLAGAGSVSALGAALPSGFSVTLGTANKINVAYSSGSTLRIENKTGGTITVALMLFRTRAA